MRAAKVQVVVDLEIEADDDSAEEQSEESLTSAVVEAVQNALERCHANGFDHALRADFAIEVLKVEGKRCE